MKPCSAQIERWKLPLMPYQFKLIYRPGKDEANPTDYLSRHPPAKPTWNNEGECYICYIANTSVPNALSLDEVQKATSLDEQLKNVMSAIMNGHWNDKSVSAVKSVKEELSVFDGIILRQNCIVIPTALQVDPKSLHLTT
ncbi:defective in cullin neddylation protein [Elysia marginata]|uniref:Defective in cullin neddylation protein n=1 Tax=Elysia marginata TaxID=1093978 RepID=A0AAV4IYU7_9GAST|nr:defective in cullin neddylation protein [Elysia marginata]